MRIALILFALLAAGCNESASEKAEKAAMTTIRSTAEIDFTQRGDINLLSSAIELCLQSSRDGCTAVALKTKIVADAVASCANNHSQLCQTISTMQALRHFDGGVARHLPDHPFYWSLDNQLLDAQEETFNFRNEMWHDWLDRWRVFLWQMLALILTIAILWFMFWLHFETEAARKTKEAKTRAAEAQAKTEEARRIQEAARRAQEATRADAEAQATAKAARRAKKAAELVAEAQARIEIEAKEEAKRVKDETAAAIAAAFGKKPNR
jgi:hypothetical protein